MKTILLAFFLALPSPLLSQTLNAFVYSGEWNNKKLPLGGLYRHDQLTCSHPSLPIGAAVRVTNIANSRSVDLLVNDAWRGKPAAMMISAHAAAILKIAKDKPNQVTVQSISHPVASGATTRKVEPKPAARVQSSTKPETDKQQNQGIYFLEFASYKTKVQASMFAKKLSKARVPTKVMIAPDGLHYVISNGYFSDLNPASIAHYHARNSAGYVSIIKRLQ